MQMKIKVTLWHGEAVQWCPMVFSPCGDRSNRLATTETAGWVNRIGLRATPNQLAEFMKSHSKLIVSKRNGQGIIITNFRGSYMGHRNSSSSIAATNNCEIVFQCKCLGLYQVFDLVAHRNNTILQSNVNWLRFLCLSKLHR